MQPDASPPPTSHSAAWSELWRMLLRPNPRVFAPPATPPETVTAPPPTRPEPIATDAGESSAAD
jgi:hypothetical protein